MQVYSRHSCEKPWLERFLLGIYSDVAQEYLRLDVLPNITNGICWALTHDFRAY